MSCNGWKLWKNYRLNDDFCARNIEMRDASRKKTGSSHFNIGINERWFSYEHLAI